MTATATIYERMVAIVEELPAIGKTDYNEQQKFHFRGHDAVLNALNPLLAKHGVFVVPNVLERTTSERTTRSGSVMFEVSLHVEFAFYGAAGDSFTGSTWGEGTDMGDKATSKAMTMAFKSMLNQSFAISNAEASDPDAETVEESTAAARTAQAAQTTQRANSSTISEPQQKRLFAIANEKKVDTARVKELIKQIAGVDHSNEIPKAKYDELCSAVAADGIPL